MSPSYDVPVVVVGAGPTGVTAAILLAQAGIDVVVLERWTAPFAQPRAVHLDDEVFRILGRLGVGEEFRKVSRPGAGLRLVAPDHRVLAQFDRLDPASANGYPQASMFDQPDLEAILRRRVAELDRVDLRGGVDVTSVRVTADGAAEVVHRDRATGDEQVLRAAYVLGCDGANSVVRRCVGSRMVGQGFRPQRWLVVDVATPRDLGHWEGVHQVCDGRRAATYMRIGETRHRWEVALLDHERADDYATIEQLAPLLAPWETRLDDLRLVRTAEYTFRAQVAYTWRRGPAFLLGDAAHLTPPFIGQGLGAGLRDAANLAWKLAAVLHGTLPADVLDSYEEERRPHATALVRLAVVVGRAMTGGGRTGDRLRDVVVPTLAHVPGLRGLVLDSTTPALRRSALVGAGPLAGTLCPNPVLSDGRRLDDVVDGGWAVVVRSRAPVVPGAAVVDASRTPALAEWLGRHEAALVRPDGTVLVADRLARVVDRAAGLLTAGACEDRACRTSTPPSAPASR